MEVEHYSHENNSWNSMMDEQMQGITGEEVGK